MARPVLLRGYRFSVYNRIARVALHEKGVAHDIEEVNPFAAGVPQGYRARHPFGRVPVLSHGAFDIHETAAILRYVDAAFDGPGLVPTGAEALGRAAQVVSIIDNYGYYPMIRQVFANRVFRPAMGEPPGEDQITTGLEASRTVLGALNAIAIEGHVLGQRGFTIADCHLAPMIAYFVQAPEGAQALQDHAALAEWWAGASQCTSLRATDPGLPTSGLPT